MNDTKQKILDSAERLFGDQGYGATSLRQIIAEAGVNLAAIHYHYGSKEELLDQVVLRKADPVNRERVETLDRLEAEAAGQPVATEKVIEAFMLPAMSRVAANPQFAKLFGRLLGEGLMPTLAEKHFRSVASRFMEALARSLPELPREELRWRVHFAIGAMAHMLCANPDGGDKLKGEALHKGVRQLVAFVCGGLRAPATEIGKVEVNR